MKRVDSCAGDRWSSLSPPWVPILDAHAPPWNGPSHTSPHHRFPSIDDDHRHDPSEWEHESRTVRLENPRANLPLGGTTCGQDEPRVSGDLGTSDALRTSAYIKFTPIQHSFDRDHTIVPCIISLFSLPSKHMFHGTRVHPSSPGTYPNVDCPPPPQALPYHGMVVVCTNAGATHPRAASAIIFYNVYRYLRPTKTYAIPIPIFNIFNTNNTNNNSRYVFLGHVFWIENKKKKKTKKNTKRVCEANWASQGETPATQRKSSLSMGFCCSCCSCCYTLSVCLLRRHHVPSLSLP